MHIAKKIRQNIYKKRLHAEHLIYSRKIFPTTLTATLSTLKNKPSCASFGFQSVCTLLGYTALFPYHENNYTQEKCQCNIKEVLQFLEQNILSHMPQYGNDGLNFYINNYQAALSIK